MFIVIQAETKSCTSFPCYSRGYVPDKFQTKNIKTNILGLSSLKTAIFPHYSRFLRPRIVKTANTLIILESKTALGHYVIYGSILQYAPVNRKRLYSRFLSL